MKKIVLFLLLLCFGAVVSSLASCNASTSSVQTDQTVSSPTPQIRALTLVDWANFTYFSSCYQNTRPFSTRNGQATNDGIHFSVYTVHYGNLTDDQQLQAIVPYQCVAADASGVHVFVYTGSAQHPILLANLPQPDPRGEIANITSISISHKQLHLEGMGYSSDAPHCCPDLFVTTDYSWNGKHFVPIRLSISKR
jgi:hypothetical protein